MSSMDALGPGRYRATSAMIVTGVSGAIEPAFTGDKGVCVSLGGIVGLCLVLGTGDHVPQETGQAGLDSD
jgi:hypothetical protein